MAGLGSGARLIGEEHLGGDGAAELGLVLGDVVFDRSGLGDLPGEDRGEASDGGGGFGEALRVVGIFFGRLMEKRAAGGAGGDVGEGVRAVGGVDEVALRASRRSRAPPRVTLCGSSARRMALRSWTCLGSVASVECFAEAGSVEGDFDGVGGRDREAEAAGGVG